MKRKDRNRERRARGGFTLIEILLVVAIIGLLATLVTVSVPRHLERARLNRARADIRAIGVAIQSYYMDMGRFPGSLEDLVEGDDPYLEGGIPLDPWQGEYVYTHPAAQRGFRYSLQTTTPEGRVIANWNLDEREGSATTSP